MLVDCLKPCYTRRGGRRHVQHFNSEVAEHKIILKSNALQRPYNHRRWVGQLFLESIGSEMMLREQPPQPGTDRYQLWSPYSYR